MSLTTKIDVSEPDKFQMATVVVKNSRLGITNNKRLLAIRRGYLYYYSNVPKQFKGDSKILQTIHELPKCSIEIANIKQIKGYENNSSYFSIEFEAKNMLEKEDIRRTMTLEQYNFSPKNTKEIIVWQFTCDNQFIKQRWVNAIESLRTYYTKQKRDIEKFFNDHNSEMKSSSSGGRNSAIPWRESQKFKKTQGNSSSGGGQISYLQVLDSGRDQNTSSQSNKISKSGSPFLEQPSQSRLRGVSNTEHHEKEDNKFAKMYSPTQKSNFENQGISISHKQHSPKDQSLASSPSKSNSQSSPIKMMYTTEEEVNKSQKQSPINYGKSAGNPNQPSHPVIVEEENENSIQTPAQSLRKVPSEQMSSSLNDQADDFEMEIQGIEESRTKEFNQPSPQIKKISSQNSKNSSPRNKSKSSKSQEFVIEAHQSSESSYYQIQQSLFKGSFEDKIAAQKSFFDYISAFRSRSESIFQLFVNSFTSDDELNAKFQVFHRNNSGLFIRYSDIRFKVCLTTSQSLMINGKERVYFDEENIKNLKRQFKVYDLVLNKVIIPEMKKKDSEFTHSKLRVPLCVFVEYKGIVGLAFQEPENEQIADIGTESVKKKYSKELSHLSKYDLKQAVGLFSFKEVTSINSNKQFLVGFLHENKTAASKNQEGRKNYLKTIINKLSEAKNSNMDFDPPFTEELIKKAKRLSTSTSVDSLENYISSLSCLTDFEGICPKEEIIEVLQMIHFCKKVRKLYRSAQGEIHETHFLNLILRHDQSMLQMIEQSGCDNIPAIKGIFFNFVRYYMGIDCHVNENFFLQKDSHSTKDPILSTEAHPISRIYNCESLEIFESFEHIDKYIKEGKLSLAHHALQVKQVVYPESLNSPRLDYQEPREEILYQMGCLLSEEKDLLGCIRVCKQLETTHQSNKAHRLSRTMFLTYLLLMKSYSQLSETELTEYFEKAIHAIQFSFGQRNSNLITIYCVASYYYLRLYHRNTSKNKRLLEVAVKVLTSAKDLTLQLFGENSKQNVHILMDLARIYQNENPTVSNDYFLKARAIAVSMISNNKIEDGSELVIDILMYDFLQSYKVPSKVQYCEKILDQIFEKINTSKTPHAKIVEIYKQQFEFGKYLDKSFLCKQSIENLWAIGSSTCKKEAISMAYQHAVSTNLISQERVSEVLQGESKKDFDACLLEIEEEYTKNSHESIWELLKQTVQDREEELLQSFIIVGMKDSLFKFE